MSFAPGLRAVVFPAKTGERRNSRKRLFSRDSICRIAYTLALLILASPPYGLSLDNRRSRYGGYS